MESNEFEIRIRALRKQIDADIEAVKRLVETQKTGYYPKSIAETTLSLRALQTAKHWLGEALGVEGITLPAEYADKS